MLTELVKEELMALGIRHRADYLVEQSGYSTGVAALDGPALKEVLPKGYLEEVTTETAKLNTLRQDKALTDAESKATTQAQGNAVRDGKICRRKISNRGLMAKRMGKTVPAGLIKISHGNSAPALATELAEKAKLLEANLTIIPGAVARFYEQKGRVYMGLKVIHDAGHALHAGDPVASARYNFNILYRKTGGKNAKAPEAEAKKQG